MAKPIAREVAIINAGASSVELYTLPQKVKTSQDLEDYLSLELEIDNDCGWIAGDKIILTDYRVKRKSIDDKNGLWNF